MLSEQRSPVDVIFYANISPMKRGSFEDFMLILAEEAAKQKISILFVFLQGEAEIFKNRGIDYLPLTKEDFNSHVYIANLVERTKAKCIHLNFTGIADRLIVDLKRKGISAVIYTDHTSTRSKPENMSLTGFLKKIRRFFFIRYIDKIIAVSDFVAANIEKKTFISHSKVETIHNGIDIVRFSPAENNVAKSAFKAELLGVDKNSSVILYAGQFIREKGIHILGAAIPFLLKRHHDLFFVFVGKGPLCQETLEAIPPQMRSRTRFLGLRDDMENILRASDIMVVPSIWQEAFGLVAAEAAACGIPVVASKTGGLPEVVLDGETGILFPPGDVLALVEELDKLVCNFELRTQIGISARKHAEENYDIRQQVNAFLSLYRDFLSC